VLRIALAEKGQRAVRIGTQRLVPHHGGAEAAVIRTGFGADVDGHSDRTVRPDLVELIDNDRQCVRLAIGGDDAGTVTVKSTEVALLVRPLRLMVNVNGVEPLLPSACVPAAAEIPKIVPSSFWRCTSKSGKFRTKSQ
jgi:hypothetical protein